MPASSSAYGGPAVVPSGSRVVLVVSRGPQLIAAAVYDQVPDVAGLPQGQALSQLQSSGFNARVFNDHSASVARGRVMGQVPSASTTLPSGSDVVLVVSSGPPEITGANQQLPDVVGMKEEEAVAAVRRAHLEPHITNDHSPSVPAGVVMAQLPSRSSLAAAPAKRSNWAVWAIAAAVVVLLAGLTLVLLTQCSQTTVPTVVGLTEAEAITELADAGLGSVLEASANPGDAVPGTVVSQNPVAGERVPEGTQVTLAVARAEEELVRVPNVIGLAQAEAVQSLEALGLTADTRTQADEDADPGTVIAQNPTQAARVPAGSRVSLTVAEAAESETVEVPQVTGVARADAESTIEGLGLRTEIIENPSADVAAGVVIAQLPEPGVTAAPGSTVAIVVSAGVPEDGTTVAVPDVVGDELPDAQETIAKAGLKSQPVETAGNAENSGDVLAQWPEKDGAASPGSTVVLLYAR